MAAVYVFLAEGFEEIEGLTVVDLLRRAGIEVKMIGIDNREYVTGSHGICVKTDGKITDFDFKSAEALVLPGGMPGTKHLGECEALKRILLMADAAQSRIGAICAAPSVLGELGILEGRHAVCYPGFEEKLKGASVGMEPVAVDGHITTSRGMGTAIDFGLALIAQISVESEARRVGKGIMYLEEEQVI